MPTTNPLLSLHHAADAETQAYDAIEIVTTFGQPQAEYASIRKAVGLMDQPHRALLEFTGGDRLAFLNNQLTNALWDKTTQTGPGGGSVTRAFYLNLKGRVVADLRVIELGNRTLVETDARLTAMLCSTWNRYLFAEQVTMTDRRGDWHQLALIGPRVDEVLAGIFQPTDATITTRSASRTSPASPIRPDGLTHPPEPAVIPEPPASRGAPKPTDASAAPGLLRPTGPVRPSGPSGLAGTGHAAEPSGRTTPAQTSERANAYGATFGEVPVVLWRGDECGVPQWHVVCPADGAAAVWAGLVERFGAEYAHGKRLLRPVGWAAYNATRIEAGTPLFGIDFDLASPSLPGKQPVPAEDESASQFANTPQPPAGPVAPTQPPASPRQPGVLPAETGLFDVAVSVTKGCYLGQEIVARMYARKQVAKQLVGLRVDDDALPLAGEVLTDGQQNQVGVVTSSTMSPLLGDAAVALATVKKSHAGPGSVVQVAAEGAIRRATVVLLPFVGVGRTGS